MVIVEVADERLLAACLPVLRASFATVMAERGWTDREVPTNAAFMTMERLLAARDGGTRMFAALVDGGPVGCVSLRAARGGGVAAVELVRLGVVAGHRHHGHGAALLAHACAVAAAGGATEVRIGIIADQVVLRDWYQRLGFVETGVDSCPGLPFAVCRMRRPLP